MEDVAKTIHYSDIFYSFFSDNAVSCVHQIVDHTLVYVYSGEMLVEQENRRYCLRKNQCAFLKRDHRSKAYKRPYEGEQYKGVAIVLKRDLLRKVYTGFCEKILPQEVTPFAEEVVEFDNQPSIDGLFASLYAYFDTEQEPSMEMVRLKLEESVLALLQIDRRFYPVLFDFSEPWKIDIMAFMNANYMYSLSLREMAMYTGRSLSTFKRDFKKLNGSVSPEKWVVKRRLAEVYRRIQGNVRPSEIYLDVGFKSLSHLYQAFKREYGMSLSEVRRQLI